MLQPLTLLPDQTLSPGQCVITSFLTTSTQMVNGGSYGSSLGHSSDCGSGSNFFVESIDHLSIKGTGQQDSTDWSAYLRLWYFWNFFFFFCFYSDSTLLWVLRCCLTKSGFCIHWMRFSSRHSTFSLWTSPQVYNLDLWFLFEICFSLADLSASFHLEGTSVFSSKICLSWNRTCGLNILLTLWFEYIYGGHIFSYIVQ